MFCKAFICLLNPWMLTLRSVWGGATTSVKFNRFVSISPSKSLEHHCDPISGRLWVKTTSLSHGEWDLTAEWGVWIATGVRGWGQKGARKVWWRRAVCKRHLNWEQWIQRGAQTSLSSSSRLEALFHHHHHLKVVHAHSSWCTHLPAGRKDRFHFQRISLLSAVFRSRVRSQ